MNMVRSTATPEEIESFDEAASLEDISHMPARVKCATLGWKTMQRMLRDGESEGGSRQNCGNCTP
jgi:nitrogen fixation NifU-like protein